MLLFAHTGLTLGTGLLLTRLVDRCSRLKVADQPAPPVVSQLGERSENKNALRTRFSSPDVDLRVLLFGSLLPDIIDKPLGQFFFREALSNGRIFGHTLLFLAAISLIGYYLYRRRHKIWLLVISFGSFMHLVLDQMWRNPHTLLWPTYGFSFEKVELDDWIQGLIKALHTNPAVYVPELIGFFILVWFTWSLARKQRLICFLKFGLT